MIAYYVHIIYLYEPIYVDMYLTKIIYKNKSKKLLNYSTYRIRLRNGIAAIFRLRCVFNAIFQRNSLEIFWSAFLRNYSPRGNFNLISTAFLSENWLKCIRNDLVAMKSEEWTPTVPQHKIHKSIIVSTAAKNNVPITLRQIISQRGTSFGLTEAKRVLSFPFPSYLHI